MSSVVKMEAEEASTSGTVQNVQKTKKGKKECKDFTLAEKWEESKHVRKLVAADGRLIRWESKELANVITLSALGLNADVMCVVAEVHCAKTQVAKPPTVDYLKAQARSKKGYCFLIPKSSEAASRYGSYERK